MTNVKVFSDLGCPFCFIATGIVDKLKEDGVDFTVEWIPHEIHPEVSLEGESLYDSFPKTQVHKMFKMLGRIGEPYDIKFGDVDMMFNTHKALLAGEYAKSVNKYDSFSKEVFKTIFTDVINIGDKDILDEIAKKVELDIAEMNTSIDEGKYDDKLEMATELVDKHNIEEVPTFIINDKRKIINVRNYERIKKAILEAK